MATVINLPKDTRFQGIGQGLAQGLQVFADKRDKKRRLEAFQKALGGLEEGMSEVEVAKALGEFMDPGDIANLIVKNRGQNAGKAPRRISVFDKDGSERQIEVPFAAPPITNVDDLTAAAPGARTEGFSLTKPPDVRGREIRDLVSQGVPRARAVNLTDERERIEIVPQLGVARYINEVTGSVKEVKLGSLTPAELNLPSTRTVTPEGTEVTLEEAEDLLSPSRPQKTLMELAVDGTGLWSGLRAAYSLALGVIGSPESIPVAEDTINARQGLRLSSGFLARELAAVSSSSRAEKEIENIRSMFDLEPGFVDSTTAMQARIVAAHRSLKQQARTFKETANDLSLSEELRSESGAMARVIERFLPTMGVAPEQEFQSPEDVVPEGDTLGRFAGMTREQLGDIDVEAMPEEELQFYINAWKALGAK